MKFATLIIIITSFLLFDNIAGTYAYSGIKKTETMSAKSEAINAIQLFDGEPDRKYTVIDLIYVASYSSKELTRKAKKEAYKMGADAVIRVEINTDKQRSSSYTQLFGFYYAEDSKYFLKGVAVKWH